MFGGGDLKIMCRGDNTRSYLALSEWFVLIDATCILARLYTTFKATRKSYTMEDFQHRIAPLSADDANRIFAFEIVTDVPTLIQYMVRNSTEAEATKIKITCNVRREVRGQFLDIAVQDNGHGIEPLDRAVVARHYHARDMKKEDVSHRGLDLASAVYASKAVKFATKTKEEEHGEQWELRFDKNTNAKGHCKKFLVPPRYDPWSGGSDFEHGTCVEIVSLFEDYPIRLRLELATLEKVIPSSSSLVKSWAMLYPEVEIQFSNSIGTHLVHYIPVDQSDSATAANQMFRPKASFELFEHVAADGWKILVNLPTTAGISITTLTTDVDR
jgi:DNA mismatch repair ATPase MutL